MLTTFEKHILGPIEEAFRDLPELYPSLAGEAFSPEFKQKLRVIIDAQIRGLPSGLFLMTHLYNNIQKLIALGSSTARSKTQLANGAQQAKQKYVPTQLGADEKIRREKILSEIKNLIERIARLMSDISFLRAAPKYKEGQLETYWNQDLELIPGSLVFNLNPPAQRIQVQGSLVAFAPAESSSVELAEQTATPNCEMALEDLEPFIDIDDTLSLGSERRFRTANEISLFSLEWIEDTPKISCATDLNVVENLLADSNTAGIDSTSIAPGLDFDLQEGFSYQEFGESHQTTDFPNN